MTEVGDDDAVVWSFVKFDIADKSFVDEARAWFNGHISDLVKRDGMMRAWRTEELPDDRSHGDALQEFITAYVMASPELFRMGPRATTASQAPPPPPPEEQRTGFNARTDLLNWGRDFFDPLAAVGASTGPPGFWIREAFDVEGPAGSAERCETYWRDEYLPRVVELSGVRAAWLLRTRETDLNIGDPPAGHYLHIFEVDSPDAVLSASRPDLRPTASLSDAVVVTAKATYVAKLFFNVEHADLV